MHAHCKFTLQDTPDSPPGRPAGLEIGAAGWRDLRALAGVQRRAFPPRFAYTLSTLAVDPAAQRQGVGAALLHTAEETLPSGDMTLMVQTGNAPARALYRRVGYEEESVHPHYYGPGRPGIKMRKRRGERGAIR